MSYPGSQPRTKVTGRVELTSNNQVDIVWTEEGYASRGPRSIDLDGEYRARIVSQTMAGDWYSRSRGRAVASFRMVAASAT
ncbi:hypothetical protein FF36_05523 [Frankia torreyi]|uniref:Uncharacterized protein n=1 Tax=Frankia torreyi TaxID=1856 RepID=A0A0D8B9Y5_9ACTN|nr:MULTISPECIES: hypothetical protein [Frankia]KJE20192.1 hypothetical protein FF36_05523 [Frankia torreyi]KQC34949.1 hypothetical protein UK82_29215 [Frankia sp. ACN1ag]